MGHIVDTDWELEQNKDHHMVMNEDEESRGKVWPLNSYRIMADVVRRIAQTLGLPDTGATREEMLLIVEAKLKDDRREPRNVQVFVLEQEGSKSLTIELQDEDGAFKRIEPEQWTRDGGHNNSVDDKEEDEEEEEEEHDQTHSDGDTEKAWCRVEELDQALEIVRGEKELLEGKVTTLEEFAAKEKERYSQLWRLNCDQLSDYDAALADKEDEIVALKKRIAELEAASSLPVVSGHSGAGTTLVHLCWCDKNLF